MELVFSEKLTVASVVAVPIDAADDVAPVLHVSCAELEIVQSGSELAGECLRREADNARNEDRGTEGLHFECVKSSASSFARLMGQMIS